MERRGLIPPTLIGVLVYQIAIMGVMNIIYIYGIWMVPGWIDMFIQRFNCIVCTKECTHNQTNMKTITDDNFKINALFSNETFIIWISFWPLLGDLE